MADVLLRTVIQNLGSFVQEELASFLGVGELTQRLSGNLTAILKSYFIKRPKDISPVYEEGQISSRTLMTLSMIHQVPINQRYCYPFTDNVRMTTKHLSPHLEIIVVSGLRAIYIIIIVRISYDNFITYYVVFSQEANNKSCCERLADAAHVLDDLLDECSITSKAHGDNKCITRFLPKKILAQRDVGKRMKAVAKKIDVIAKDRMKYGLQVGVTEERQRGADEWRQTTSVVTEPVVYGRYIYKEQIVKFPLKHTTDKEELSVYSIVGLGEYGKTTLAQLVYNNERHDEGFRAVIEDTIGKNPDLSSLESMRKKVQEIFKTKDQEKWNKFKSLLQYETKGASILVTARLDIVASIMATYHAHRLTRLSDSDIWSLFKQQAFRENREERAELVEIGKKLVRKCVGSTLAAKVLGSSLRFTSDEHQWISVLESEFWNLTEDDPIMSVLRLSYFNLKLSLRPCFTFCAVFPKDFEMVKENLIHLWMANGLVTSRGNLQMEDVGNEVWNELYQRSFFQEVKSDFVGNITFKMHDFIHDLGQSFMGEECISYDVSKLTNFSIRVHHISLFDNKSKDDYMIPFQKFDSLRTFLEYKPPSKNLNMLLSSTPLRALHASFHQLSSLMSLIHLRYLELNQSPITILPGSVCRLQKLQTLKLERCHFLSSFPKQLIELKDLRHLMIKNCHSLMSSPFKIGKFTCLKTWSIFIVDSKTGYGGNLHIKVLENVSNEEHARDANLIGKKDLNRLYLSWGGYANSQVSGVDAERVLDALEPHSGLKHFGVNGYGGIHFPLWMRNTSILKGLVSIILYGCKNCRQFPPFGKLPCLTILYVSKMRDIKYIDDDLVLEVEGVEMLPQPLKLNIINVPKLTLSSLPYVESLTASGRNEELLKSIFYNNFSEDLASSSRGIAGNNLRSLSCCEFVEKTTTIRLDAWSKLIPSNQIKRELPVELGTLGALESLNIDSCHEMESFSEQLLQGLSSLRKLSVRSCSRFKSLPDGMRHLTSLVIGDCSQFVFPQNMDSLTSLRQPEVFGDCLGAMTSVQELQIYGFSKLSSVPDNFQQLQNLQMLCIDRCPMLEKRCKRGIGEDWHKIAHIPRFVLNRELQSDVEQTKPTICENIKSAWKQFWHRPSQYPDFTYGEFDWMIEKEVDSI
ncbi:NB-ARC domain disease resistance protein [Medicago truncatula]|uniref:NB-ARC domain disease resistance protein n=1 Tax=Medicago truncatula TaxID=3880 RepID=G7KKJ6_MEDTR|nr:NB-ARC domain disease resistance protein [Medicago truncatula]